MFSHHSKGLRKSFPFIWLIGLRNKITKIRIAPVLFSHLLASLELPKIDVLLLIVMLPEWIYLLQKNEIFLVAR